MYKLHYNLKILKTYNIFNSSIIVQNMHRTIIIIIIIL